jgi:hypothetical protein
LGIADMLAELRILWPDGHESKIENDAANHLEENLREVGPNKPAGGWA